MKRKPSQTSRDKPEVTVTLDIKYGPSTPAQQQAWKRFWQKLIAEVKTDER